MRFYHILLLLLLFSSIGVKAQDSITVKQVPIKELLSLEFDYGNNNVDAGKDKKKEKKKEIPKPTWTKTNNLGLNLSEVAFMNWQAGGENAITTIGKGNFVRKYVDRYLQWNNELIVRYGLNIQEGQKIRKSDDAFQFNSTFGYRKDSISNWFYSAKFNFNTQMTNGYNYPDRDNPISRLMAPGYVFTGIGMEYSNDEDQLTVYLSPMTYKATFVLDQDLANDGAFGVQGARYDGDGNVIEAGEKYFGEFGILVTNTWEEKLGENMVFNNRLSLYTDYINSFGNIDIDWEMTLDLIVNKFVKANIGVHTKYDNDVKFKESEDEYGNAYTYGPKMQLKQILGVGVVYAF
ncbi:Protein of unknown function [Pustulibacterium marinum]|uniref:DUF3078 domain-containing protein n=1 Tax=Pustulibacterium marinum TaxID=1224947 RepID=A0A1I7EXH6_9FLAO|nr:DUF3078 domain-containing protein [Pustulibacterium marinum]SFU28611.1 Protein of unknown function [Pustulibacterium marinum]